jgi:hypothetical protein
MVVHKRFTSRTCRFFNSLPFFVSSMRLRPRYAEIGNRPPSQSGRDDIDRHPGRPQAALPAYDAQRCPVTPDEALLSPNCEAAPVRRNAGRADRS